MPATLGVAGIPLVWGGAPNGIRTRAAALKGRSPRPLDDGSPGCPLGAGESIGQDPPRLQSGCPANCLRCRAGAGLDPSLPPHWWDAVIARREAEHVQQFLAVLDTLRTRGDRQLGSPNLILGHA